MYFPLKASNHRHRLHVLARAVTCSLLLVLPSCMIPKLRPTETGSILPATFNGATSAENSAQLRVDEFYNDPTLTMLVCQAVATNRELKMLEEDVQIARAEILARRGAFLPMAGFRAGAGWDRNSRFTPLGAAEKEIEYLPGRHFPNTPGDSLLGFNYFIPLDIWRELRNARDAAIQRYFAAIERRNYFVTRMVADIAENYYGLMALDLRIANLNLIIEFQQQSLDVAKARFQAGRDSELSVQRFQAEVRKNQSERLIVGQEIIETENRINFLAGRLPQRVQRDAAGFYVSKIRALSIGVPSQLLLNRTDIRQAERELVAAGLDVQVTRARFFPRVDITGAIGYQAFNPRYLFDPEALVFNAAGELTAPLINRAAIRADYLTANAKQLQSVYNYQRVIINAFTEVVNRLAMVENYRRSIVLKNQQITALKASVELATLLYKNPREKVQVDYMDVLFAQRDLLEANKVLIDTRRQQLVGIVNAYQALGGGSAVSCPPPGQDTAAPPQTPEPGQLLPSPRPVPEPGPMPGPGKQPQPIPPAKPKQPEGPMAGAVAPVPLPRVEWMRRPESTPVAVGREPGRGNPDAVPAGVEQAGIRAAAERVPDLINRP